MRRENDFDKYKIYVVSNDKYVTNVYCSSFAIEKVRIQNCEYANGDNREDFYLDFADLSMLASGVTNGQLLKTLAEKGKYEVARGESKGKTKVLTLGYSNNKVYINILTWQNNEDGTVPSGEQAKQQKFSNGMSVGDFKKLILYTHDCMQGYLASFIGKMVKEAEAERVQR